MIEFQNSRLDETRSYIVSFHLYNINISWRGLTPYPSRSVPGSVEQTVSALTGVVFHR